MQPDVIQSIDEKRRNLLGDTWFTVLKSEFDQDYMTNMGNWLANRRGMRGIAVYPPSEDIFKAFRLTPLNEVKVVILGQDPYHTPGIANGLAFASGKGLTCPPSLEVIFNEMESDVQFGLYLDRDYSLEYLAKQGVLLLNTVLTVEKGQPKSHARTIKSQGIGWEQFNGAVLRAILATEQPKVFMLWGKIAQEAFNGVYHSHTFTNGPVHVLEAYHPAYESRIATLFTPGIATGWFYGCGHFSKANEWLKEYNVNPIRW